MRQSFTREKVMENIKLIPEHKLEKGYDFVHYFRLSLQEDETGGREQICKFARSWNDLPEEIFKALIGDITERWTQAFSRRGSA